MANFANYASIVPAGIAAGTAAVASAQSVVASGKAAADAVKSLAKAGEDFANLILDCVGADFKILIPSAGGAFDWKLPDWLRDNPIINALITAFEWIMKMYNEIKAAIAYIIKLIRETIYNIKMWILQKIEDIKNHPCVKAALQGIEVYSQFVQTAARITSTISMGLASAATIYSSATSLYGLLDSSAESSAMGDVGSAINGIAGDVGSSMGSINSAIGLG